MTTVDIDQLLRNDEILQLLDTAEQTGSLRAAELNEIVETHELDALEQDAVFRELDRRGIELAEEPVAAAELWRLAREWKVRPVRALTGRSEGIDTWEDDGFVGEPLLPHKPERINSVVLRHERTLEHMVVRSMVVADDDGTVTLITHKQAH